MKETERINALSKEEKDRERDKIVGELEEITRKLKELLLNKN